MRVFLNQYDRAISQNANRLEVVFQEWKIAIFAGFNKN